MSISGTATFCTTTFLFVRVFPIASWFYLCTANLARVYVLILNVLCF